jgi:hypothetical protein
LVRCGKFRHRPSHADALHLDLWWRGLNIALDAGTFSYNDDGGWDRSLPRTEHHNSVTVDGRSQMDQISRFLWLPWLRAECRHQIRSHGGHLAYWEGSHDGYHRLANPVDCRRGVVRLGDEHWIVVDELNSAAVHRYRLHWLLLDLPYTAAERRDVEPPLTAHWFVTLQTPNGPYQVNVGALKGGGAFGLVRSDDSSPRGWRAPSTMYMRLESAISLSLTQDSAQTRFWTLFGPPVERLTVRGDAISVKTEDWNAVITLGPGSDRPLLSNVGLSLAGNEEVDRIELGG